MSDNLFCQLPTELWEHLFLHIEFSDIVSTMITCSEMWQRFRYNFSFWTHYHIHKYGKQLDLPLKKLGDPFRSVKKRAYGVWILAEKVIDILYEWRCIIGSRGSCCVYGGYLRDRLARRIYFRDINVSMETIGPTDVFFSQFHDQLDHWGFTWARAKSIDADGWRYIIRSEGNRVIVHILFAQYRDLAIDFDVNGLYLVDRHTHGLKYSNDPFELDKVMANCQKRQFSLKSIHINSMDDLMARYQYMLELGFTPVETNYVVPTVLYGSYD